METNHTEVTEEVEEIEVIEVAIEVVTATIRTKETEMEDMVITEVIRTIDISKTTTMIIMVHMEMTKKRVVTRFAAGEVVAVVMTMLEVAMSQEEVVNSILVVEEAIQIVVATHTSEEVTTTETIWIRIMTSNFNNKTHQMNEYNVNKKFKIGFQRS